MVRAGVQVRAVVMVRVVRPLDRTNYSVQRAIPSKCLAIGSRISIDHEQTTRASGDVCSRILITQRARTTEIVQIYKVSPDWRRAAQRQSFD